MDFNFFLHFGLVSNVTLALNLYNKGEDCVFYVSFEQVNRQPHNISDSNSSLLHDSKMNQDRVDAIVEFCEKFKHNTFLFASSIKNPNRLYKAVLNCKGSKLKLIPIIEMV